jgi:uncharacterized SAM-binding protein YcdF (DUF218 family)
MLQWYFAKIFISLRRIFGILGILGVGIALGALCLAFLLAGEIYDYQDSVDGKTLPPVDAIVCLAGGRGRISTAGDVWFRYWEQVNEKGSLTGRVPILYFSGMGRQANWIQVSSQLRRGILQTIRQSDTVIETESFNTDANARWFLRYAQKKHWKRILLLTSNYHMKRARFIFEEVLKGAEEPIQVETLSLFQEPFSPEEWRFDLNGVRVTLWEYLKWVYYKTVWQPN